MSGQEDQGAWVLVKDPDGSLHLLPGWVLVEHPPLLRYLLARIIGVVEPGVALDWRRSRLRRN